MINLIKKMLEPLKRKIFLLLGRALVTYVTNSGGTQKLQISVLKDELIDGVERFEEYGFTTYPKAGAEGAVMFLNGNRDHGIVLCVNDRRYRPKTLAEGEVCMYNFSGTTIIIEAGGNITMSPSVSVNVNGDVIADGISLKNHVHTYVTPLHPSVNGNTSAPNP